MNLVNLSPRAQDKALELKLTQGEDKAGLRIAVVGGGCAGLSYKLGFDNPKEDDFVQEFGELKVFVDPKSAILLQGSSLEFLDGLDRSGFEIINPNATGGCGCGKSFSG